MQERQIQLHTCEQCANKNYVDTSSTFESNIKIRLDSVETELSKNSSTLLAFQGVAATGNISKHYENFL